MALSGVEWRCLPQPATLEHVALLKIDRLPAILSLTSTRMNTNVNVGTCKKRTGSERGRDDGGDSQDL
jgi:hypothetical protein